MLTPLHNPSGGFLRVAGFMSGSGTNLRRILEHRVEIEKREGSSPFRMVAIFSNDIRSKAPEIGRDFDVPVIIRDMIAWYAKRGAPRSDLNLRKEFDAETVAALSPYRATVVVYGGYMAIATETLMKAFLGINVHPADLSILNEKGGRRFTGDHAVLDAIIAGEKAVASTTHIVEAQVDMGRLLMISAPLHVEIPPGADLTDKESRRKVSDANQDRLKEKGDWIIFPRTIEYIARGRYATDENGAIYFDGKPIPHGLRLKNEEE